VAGNDVQTVDVGGVHRIAHIGMVDDAFVDRAVYLADVYTKAAGRIGLWVGIHHEYRLLQCRQ
jgi:hydrogenase maturation factor